MEANLQAVNGSFHTPMGRERATLLRSRLQASKQELVCHLAKVTASVEEPKRDLGKAASPTRARANGAGAVSGHERKVAPEAREGVSVSGVEYTVTLDKSDGRKLGISIECFNAQVLVITEIQSGLVQEWNVANPGHMVRAGDHIIDVNGIRGDASHMANECERQVPLRCQMRRASVAAGVAPDMAALAALAGASADISARAAGSADTSETAAPPDPPSVDGGSADCAAGMPQSKEGGANEDDGRHLVAEAEHLVHQLTTARVAEMPIEVRNRLSQDLDRLKLLLSSPPPAYKDDQSMSETSANAGGQASHWLSSPQDPSR